jgi:RNase P/RNase MRP subunit p29
LPKTEVEQKTKSAQIDKKEKLMTLATQVEMGGEQISISGDDILIEYCERLLSALCKIPE